MKSQQIAPFLAGTVASTTGSVATFGIALAGLAAMNATAEQASTAIAVSLFGYGLLSIILSWRLKMPVSVVWSTPGAAFLATSTALGATFQQAVAGFMLSAILLLLTALWPVLGKLVAKIPPSISAAMLAGVIFPFVISVVHASVDYPALLAPVVICWLVLNKWLKIWASPVAILLGFVLIGLSSVRGDQPTLGFWPEFLPVLPDFSAFTFVAIGVPLYLITMASQNLPGLAIMQALGFSLPTKQVLGATGSGSLIASVFGSFGLNLAAITAALNADEHAAKEPSRRWIAAAFGGVVYIIFGLLTVPFASFVLSVPRELLLSLAGLALLNTFAGALKTAVAEDDTRLPAIITFLIGAAGITVLNIGGAFWALVVGLTIWLFLRANRAESSKV